MKYIFAYEMMYLTKRCVTFNIYGRNFSFQNGMKSAVTLPKTPMLHNTGLA
jgi:hypothetical protein